jgi:hypothetical protein
VRSVTLSPSTQTKSTKRKRGKLDLLQETQCLICVGPRVPGKFDRDIAKKLGIPSGPLYGMLMFYNYQGN